MRDNIILIIINIIINYINNIIINIIIIIIIVIIISNIIIIIIIIKAPVRHREGGLGSNWDVALPSLPSEEPVLFVQLL